MLAAVNLGLNFDVTHSGESQSLTPFGSQHSQSSTHGSILGGLVLPSSSPAPTGRFNRKVNDDQLAFAALLDTHTSFQISDPEFTFDDDGALIEGPSVQTAVKTPMALVKAPMLSDSDISAKVRQDYEEGQMGGAQVSFTAISCHVLALASLGCRMPMLWFYYWNCFHLHALSRPTLWRSLCGVIIAPGLSLPTFAFIFNKFKHQIKLNYEY